MKALILNGIVVDTAVEEFEVHPSLTWVDCPEHVQGGVYSYDGTNFTILPKYDTPEPTEEEKMEALRRERNKLLQETDYWAAPDTPDMTQEQISYRQKLRDIPQNYNSLDDVVWPEKP